MESRFTPGPWEFLPEVGSQHNRRLIYAACGQYGRRLVADAGGIARRTDGEMTANAHLISAAPEMYEALQEARETITSAVESNVDIPDFDPATHVTVRAIDAAPAKADGREVRDG